MPIVAETLGNHGSVLLVLGTIPPARFLYKLGLAEVDIRGALQERRLRIVDWYSHKEETLESPEEEGGILRLPPTLAGLERGLEAVLEEGLPRGCLVILEVLTDVAWMGAHRLGELLHTWRTDLQGQDIATVMVLEPELVSRGVLNQAEETAETVVRLHRSPSPDGPGWRIIHRRAGADPVTHRVRIAPPFRTFTVEAAQEPLEVTVPDLPADAPGRPCPRCGAVLEEDLCPSCGYDEQKAQMERVGAILDACRERLASNPEDMDALFTQAAALARLRRYEEAVEPLNTLSRLAPRYPALWMLKAKVFDRLGDEVKANLCRKRALELEQRDLGRRPDVQVQPEEDRFQCPLCRRWLPMDANICPCGAEFVEEGA